MTNTITYFSQNAPINETWSAYVLLPTGKRWEVVAFAATEDEAKNKIINLWEKESSKGLCVQFIGRAERKIETNHHFAGKVWMIHEFSRAKKRVDASEVAQYEAEGWIKGGPRSK